MAQNPHHYPWCHAPSPMQRCSARVPINAGEVSPATMGGRSRAVSSATMPVADEVLHPIGKIQPLLIGLTLP